MGVEIIEADLAKSPHAQAILTVLDSYARDVMGGGEPLSPDTRDRVVPGLRLHPTSVVFLAFEDQRPVGIATCFIGFSTFKAMSLINVHDLAVLPEARGQGVGRQLLLAVQAKAEAIGCCKITLEVREDNARARGLYGSFGFGHFGPWEKETTTIFLEKVLARD